MSLVKVFNEVFVPGTPGNPGTPGYTSCPPPPIQDPPGGGGGGYDNGGGGSGGGTTCPPGSTYGCEPNPHVGNPGIPQVICGCIPD